MSGLANEIPAVDNEWLESAGLDPEIYKDSQTLEEFLLGNGFTTPGIDFTVNLYAALRFSGWLGTERHYSLEERFNKHGITIVEKTGGWEDCGNYDPQMMRLSNGIVLEEHLKCKIMDDNGYMITFIYEVVRVK